MAAPLGVQCPFFKLPPTLLAYKIMHLHYYRDTYHIAPVIESTVACTSDPITFLHLYLVTPAYFSGTGIIKSLLFNKSFNFQKLRQDTNEVITPIGVNILLFFRKQILRLSFTFALFGRLVCFHFALIKVYTYSFTSSDFVPCSFIELHYWHATGRP